MRGWAQGVSLGTGVAVIVAVGVWITVTVAVGETVGVGVGILLKKTQGRFIKITPDKKPGPIEKNPRRRVHRRAAGAPAFIAAIGDKVGLAQHIVGRGVVGRRLAVKNKNPVI